MIHHQDVKVVPLKVGTAATNATTHYTIDRLGYDLATIDVIQSPASATDSADKWVVLKVAHGDTTAVSSASDISAFVGSTATSVTSGFVIATTSNTSSPTTHRLQIDCRYRGRYLFLIVQPDANNGAFAAVASLSRARQTPSSASDLGAINFVTDLG